MVVLFLTVMIAMILIRALRKDIAQYNDAASLEDAKEESGWKVRAVLWGALECRVVEHSVVQDGAR